MRINNKIVINFAVENQEAEILSYIDGKDNLNLVAKYSDVGESGLSFERPGIKALMKAIESQEINCIIVKDLARFSRDTTDALKYNNEIFPLLKVRFISVMDNIDTEKSSDGNAFPHLDILRYNLGRATDGKKKQKK